MSGTRRTLLGPLAACALLLVGCSAARNDRATPAAQDVIASGLAAPWSIVFAGEVPIVSERDTGDIREILADGTSRVIGTVDGVVARGEGGLLGLVMDDEAHLFAYSTAGDGNRIQRFELIGDAGELALGRAQTIIDGLPAAGNHNGGRIAFGPDGMLYVTVGDAGSPESAQDIDSLGGKILRLTPDGGVPADNPFAGSPVYSLGHRNPQGIAWSTDGTMYASEFGQNTWDELNIIVAGGNYGWPEAEGIADASGYLDPVQQWAPSDASPSGIAVHDDAVYIANLRGERLRVVPISSPTTSTEHLTAVHGRVRDVVVAPDGTLWVLTNNTDGRGEPAEGDDRIIRVG
ncbi:PQQ-dependent sugar dehydrogenase [Microbacterium sp.]|uniref:PQQ-dependent sugar dehydrogenase n=1 Tax=Microbacterium sp. TaxID=51671 RepID=UPI0028116423|nr:PQQ-dependent sugar dehydrogenase [Microbacterium sp.]